MSNSLDLYNGAKEQFGSAEIGRADRCERLVGSAAAIAAHHEASFPEILDWNQLRCLYRLCNRDEATLNALETPHWELTRGEMAQQPREFVRGVARMGGFLGRQCDGEPGSRTYWRGCQRLRDLVLGLQFHDAPHQDSS